MRWTPDTVAKPPPRPHCCRSCWSPYFCGHPHCTCHNRHNTLPGGIAQ